MRPSLKPPSSSPWRSPIFDKRPTAASEVKNVVKRSRKEKKLRSLKEETAEEREEG
jgi:hypothetical protein